MDMVRLRRGRRRRKKRKQQMEDLGQWYNTKQPNHLNIYNDDQDEDDEVVNGVVNMLNDGDDVNTTTVNIDKCTIKYEGGYATIV